MRDLKDELAWLQFPDLEAQQVAVGGLLQAYGAPALQAPTGDAFLVEAMNALVSYQTDIRGHLQKRTGQLSCHTASLRTEAMISQ